MDTTVFDQNSHDYSSAAFKKLGELIKEKKVRLYITTIIKGEVETHIRRQVESAQASIETTLYKHRFLKHSQHPSVSKVFGGMDTEEVIDELGEQFRNWLTEMSVEFIPMDVSIDNVFDKYFDRTPPFSDKKKEEFPDAFNIAALEKWCEEHKIKMYVISGDGDISAACETNLSLRYVNSLPAFLEFYAQLEPLAAYANQLFETHTGKIISQLKRTVNFHSHWPHEYNEHVVYSYVESVSLLEKHLIDVEDSNAIFDVILKTTLFERVRIPNFPMMNMGIMAREVDKRRDEYRKAEVGLLFDKQDESKFQIEYALPKEYIFYPARSYSEYPEDSPYN